MSDEHTHVIDVSDHTFEAEVVERSRSVPVVVDFWAAWCGPCRTLGPMIEAAVARRNGAVVLAKVDVDANPSTAQQFRIQGIPQVFGFRDGQPVSQFTGVVALEQLEAFLDELVPSAADEALRRARLMDDTAAEPVLRAALAEAPDHAGLAIELASRVLEKDPGGAVDLARPHRPDPAAEAVIARAALLEHGDADVAALRRAYEAGDASDDELLALGRGLAARGDVSEAIGVLIELVQRGSAAREEARIQLIDLFALVGDADPAVADGRRRLARALF